jgi:hypothetical protein
MATNVLKLVKTRKPRKRAEPRKRGKRDKVFRFNNENPYPTFIDLPIEDTTDAIDAYVYSLAPRKEGIVKMGGQMVNVPGPINQTIVTLNKVKTSLPWSLVNQFFLSINGDSVSFAFTKFTRAHAKDLEDMQNLLHSRRIDQSVFDMLRATTALRVKEPPAIVQRQQARVLDVKYTRSDLASRTKQQLNVIASRENVNDYDKLTKLELIEILSQLRNEPVQRAGEYFAPLPACELTYKRAPWMINFVQIPINGMAVNPSLKPRLARYATNIPVGIDQGLGWFRVKPVWYTDACNDRKFISNAVGYVLHDSSGPNATVVVETREMYNAANATIHEQAEIESSQVFKTSFLTGCESDYKRAPWMKQFVSVPISGMAINPSRARDVAVYATDNPVGIYEEPGWFRVKKSWYKRACEGKRDFIPNAVAYVLRDNIGSEATIIVESEEMYAASLATQTTRVDEALNPASGRVKTRPTFGKFLKRVPEFKENVSSAEIDDILYEIYGDKYRQSAKKLAARLGKNVPPSIAPQRQAELAPGLFYALRTLLAGIVFYCDKCNVEVLNPQFKSIHGDRKVLFCSTECFENYQFNRPQTLNESEEKDDTLVPSFPTILRAFESTAVHPKPGPFKLRP